MAVSGGYLTGHTLGATKTSGNKFINNAIYNERQYQHRVVQYEKEFNINISRINAEEKELRSSMLAYSNHARTLKQRRPMGHHETGMEGENLGSLQIRAKNIPKIKYLPKLEQQKSVSKRQLPEAGSSSIGVKDSLVKRLSKFNEISRAHTIPPLGGSHSVTSPGRSPTREPVRVGFASEVDLEDMKEMTSSKRAAYYHRQPPTSYRETLKGPVAKSKNPRKDDSVHLSKPTLLSSKSGPKGNGSSDDSVESIIDSQSSHGMVNIDKKREEITRRILKDAIDKLRDIENRSRDPAQLIARLKANKMRSKRLKFQRQSLDAIPEADDNETENVHQKRNDGNHSTRYSLSRERPIEHVEPNHRSLVDDMDDKDTDEFVPDISMFPSAATPSPFGVQAGAVSVVLRKGGKRKEITCEGQTQTEKSET